MTEPTSRDAYIHAYEEGILNRKQLQVLRYMQDVQHDVTQREVDRYFKDTSSSYHPRFRELERAGAITCTGTSKDQVTGRQVKKYALGRVPTEKVKPVKSKKAERHEWIKEAAKYHGAFNLDLVVEWVESLCEVKSKEAAFEIVGFMKACDYVKPSQKGTQQ